MASASGCLEYCSRLEVKRENFVFFEARGDDLFVELRLAVGERAGLVEDHRPAVSDLFEDGRVADDDAAAGGERDTADDGDGNRDQQRAGSGDDQHGEKADGLPADEPGGESDGDGDRRVDLRRADRRGGECAGCRCCDSCITAHDLGVARIDGATGRRG